MMDINLLEKGEDFDALPEVWVIFITEKDVMGQGKSLYQIERCILGTGESFQDGSHILYVKNPYLHSVGRQGIIMAISDLRGKRHGKEKRTIRVTKRNAMG